MAVPNGGVWLLKKNALQKDLILRLNINAIQVLNANTKIGKCEGEV
jgi:hypothetical protein